MSRIRKPASSPPTSSSFHGRTRDGPDCAPRAGAIIAQRPTATHPPSLAHTGPTMAGNTKRVFYVKYLAAPDYAEALAQRPDVRLAKPGNESPDDVAAPVLSQAHAYQIGSARDASATRVHATGALRGRAPPPA